MEDADLNGLGFVLALEAVGVFVEQADSLLIVVNHVLYH